MEKHQPTNVPTHNDLAPNTRKDMSKLLNHLLANASDMYSHAKQAHWNVRGRDFFSLHELFDKVAEEVLEQVDEIAERSGQLGYAVSGTVRQAGAASSIREYPIELASGDEHVEQLSVSMSMYTKSLRDGIKEAEDAEDAVTQDLLTRICGEADKLLWFVESHGTMTRTEAKTQKTAA